MVVKLKKAKAEKVGHRSLRPTHSLVFGVGGLFSVGKQNLARQPMPEWKAVSAAPAHFPLCGVLQDASELAVGFGTVRLCVVCYRSLLTDECDGPPSVLSVFLNSLPRLFFQGSNSLHGILGLGAANNWATLE